MLSTNVRAALLVAGAIIAVLLAYALIGLLVTVAWNILLPAIIGAPELTYLQGLVLGFIILITRRTFRH